MNTNIIDEVISDFKNPRFKRDVRIIAFDPDSGVDLWQDDVTHDQLAELSARSSVAMSKSLGKMGLLKCSTFNIAYFPKNWVRLTSYRKDIDG